MTDLLSLAELFSAVRKSIAILHLLAGDRGYCEHQVSDRDSRPRRKQSRVLDCAHGVGRHLSGSLSATGPFPRQSEVYRQVRSTEGSLAKALETQAAKRLGNPLSPAPATRPIAGVDLAAAVVVAVAVGLTVAAAAVAAVQPFAAARLVAEL